MNKMDFRSMAALVGGGVHELSANEVTQVQGAPQAQRKTSRYKKAVHMAGDLVFKGPYSCSDSRLMKNLANAYALGLLEEALQLTEAEKGSLRWEYVGLCGDDQCYLAAANVGRPQNIPFEVVTTRIETNVKVVPRGAAVVRVSEIEPTGRLTEEIKSAILQHLYLRYLLDIGDSGTHNILLREDNRRAGRLIAGIDLEETRNFKEKERRIDHLFKKLPSRQQRRLYEPHVRKIKPLHQLNQQTSDLLRAIGVDVTRVIENMGLWEGLS
jgi:hypothetical protein